ncbi:hypothetical protein [Gracilibacillus dipsosauri]|uniref:Uncharacterized protein n=1 Tax=Gracilibacillus dipsosauri TaxID=178340 RepID=A0A317L1P0_9BACI|nr:hypothetical protein [Gracilibacillus dipsosauri]PWU69433.1 hypothetical protein DLJ74_05510 [Gracilibacillus dipsosauri]
MKINLKKCLVTLLVAALLVSAIGPTGSVFAQENQVPNPNSNLDILELNLDGEHDGDQVDPFVLDILSAIENIPAELVNSGDDSAIAEWVEQESGVETKVVNGVLKFDPFGNQLNFNVFACVGAIGMAIVSNGIPLTKILKVKKFIDQFGGTVKFVKSVKYFYDKYRKDNLSRKAALKKAVNKVSARVGSSTKEALLDFFGISAIIGSCS